MAGTKILMIGADDTLSREINSLSADAGLQYYSVYSGIGEIIEAVNSDSPDVIVIDTDNLTDEETFNAALLIKKNFILPVFLACSIYDLKSADKYKTIQYEVIIRKPLDFPVFCSNIEAAAGRSRIMNRMTDREGKYRTLIEEINEIIFTLDEQGIVSYISSSVINLTGFSHHEIIGRHFGEFIHEKDLLEITSIFEKLKTGHKQQNEYRVKNRDGGYSWVRSFSHPVFIEGKFSGLKGIMIDITAGKMTEEQLEKSRSAISGILASAPVGIGLFKNGSLEWMNDMLSKMTGFDKNNLIGSDLEVLFVSHADYRTTLKTALKKIHEEGAALLEAVWKRTGGTMEILLSIAPVVYGIPDEGVIFTALDISERKRSERILQTQRDLAATLSATRNITEALDAILAGVLSLDEIDSGGIYLFEERTGGLRLAVHSGLSPEFIKGVEYFPPGSPNISIVEAGVPVFSAYSEHLSKSFNGASPESLMMVGVIPVHNEGKIVAAINAASHSCDSYSAVTRRALEGFASEVGDVIQRIRAEESLKIKNEELAALNEEFQATIEELEAMNEAYEKANEELIESRNELSLSESKFRTLTENNNAPVFVIQGDRIVYINRSFREMMGYSLVECSAFKFWDFFHSSDRDLIKQRGMARQRGDFVLQRYEIRMLTKYGEVKWVDLSAALIDYNGEPASLATAVDLTERKKTESELLMLGSAVEQAAEAVIIMKPDGIINYVNPAARTIFGLHPERLIGANPFIQCAEFIDMGFPEGVMKILSSGSVWRGQLSFSTNGNSAVELDAAVSPVYVKGGGLQNFIAVCRDVTTESRLQRELKQAQKLEALGTLVGGIAHDFNNIIAIIMGYAEVSFYDISPKHPVYDNLLEVLSAAKRAKDLIRQILTFSRQTEHEAVSVSVSQIIHETIKFLRASLPATIEITHKLSAENDLVLADPVQIHQILMNLCANAKHAMTDVGGRLHISLVEEKIVYGSTLNVMPGLYLVLTVSDTGCGIKNELIDKIFDPFFTTKSPGEGTGLGLSVVHGIVKSCGGTVRVESAPGKGSSFRVYLPSAARNSHTDMPIEAAEPKRGSERILLVDDEKQIVKILSRMLSSLGYTVDACSNSTEAFKKFSASPSSYDLLVTDQTMPGLTGIELSKKIFALRPGFPVVLCSGFSEVVNDESARLSGIAAFMIKPVVLNELAINIRRVLDQGKPSGQLSQ